RLVDHDTSAPYAFKWDTRRVKDGTHTVTLAGRARDGRVVRSSVSVSVANGQMQPAKIVSTSIADGQTVSGLQHWLADVGGSVKKVEFVVDGTVRGTATKAPYSYDWDTAAETPGAHELVVRATGADGTVSEQTATATVAPTEPRPATPLPTAAAATPSTISELPTGRRRHDRAATATTASVPRLFARIASSRAGRNGRWSCAGGSPCVANAPCTGAASATPTASPAYARPAAPARRTPARRSEPTPSSGAVRSAPAA